ncbi:unnamed protein product, partial [Prorocentrum cordatum]
EEEEEAKRSRLHAPGEWPWPPGPQHPGTPRARGTAAGGGEGGEQPTGGATSVARGAGGASRSKKCIQRPSPDLLRRAVVGLPHLAASITEAAMGRPIRPIQCGRGRKKPSQETQP